MEDIIMHGELGSFQNGRTAHSRLDGPDIHLSPRYVLALGMTFHELTANAARYGALSVGDGQVEHPLPRSEEGQGPASDDDLAGA